MNLTQQKLRNERRTATSSERGASYAPQYSESPFPLRPTRGHANADPTVRKRPGSVSERDWASFPLEFLIRRVLSRQHERIREQLLRLQHHPATAAKAQTADSEKITAQLTALIHELINDMDEEERIFPDLLRLEQAYVGGKPGYSPRLGLALNRLSHHNDRQVQHLDSLRKEAGRTRSEICGELGTLKAALLDHLHVEHDIVFPRAASMESELFRYSH
jgi:iron-sulfur cluster repair protein YtfE (RIC family)